MIVHMWTLALSLAADLAVSQREGDDTKYTNSSSLQVCTSKACVMAAYDLIHLMDEEVDPCEDFFGFVCGRVREEHEVLESSWLPSGGASARRESFTDRRRKIMLEEKAGQGDNKAVRLAKFFYASCMDVAAIEKVSVQEILKDLGNLTFVVPENINKSPDEHIEFISWENLSLFSQENLFTTPFMHLVWLPHTNADFAISDMSFPIPISYFQAPSDVASDGAYLHVTLTEFIFGTIDQFSNLSMADVQNAGSEILLLYRSLADIYKKGESLRILSVAKAKKDLPDLDWNTLLKVWKIPVTDQNTVALDSDRIRKVVKLLNATPKHVLHNYMVMHTMNQVYNYVAPAVMKPYVKFVSKIGGRKAPAKRWRFCVRMTKSMFPITLIKLNTRNHNDRNAVADMVNIAENVRLAMLNLVNTTKAFGDDKKSGVKEKIKNITIELFSGTKNLSYDPWVDHFPVNSSLKFQPFHSAFIQLKKAQYQYSHQTSLEDRIEYVQELESNAVYKESEKVIAFGFNYLHKKHILGGPAIFNYGRLAMVAGHELGHAFGLRSVFTTVKAHSFKGWLGPTYFLTYVNSLKCRQQWSLYDELASKNVSMSYLRAEETYADNLGLKVAFQAFKSLTTTDQQTMPPGLVPTYSPSQIFFIAVASGHCEFIMENKKYRKMYADRMTHLFGHFRVNQMMKHSHDFAHAFACPVGSPMNPKDKCLSW